MTEIVVVDACVLVKYNLCHLLLTLAESDLFEIRWSEQILDETERTLVRKLKLPEAKAQKRLSAMRNGFPEAAVHGFEWMEKSLTCQRKDRHVLAAAIAAGASIIVTENLPDFPESACAPHEVVALHPETFLLGLLSHRAIEVAAAVERAAAPMRQPSLSTADLLARITPTAPTFANQLHQFVLDGKPAPNEIPAYLGVPSSETPLQEYIDNPDLGNPLHVAFAWWEALLDEANGEEVLKEMTHSPAAFKGYRWAMDMLQHRSIASRVYYAVDAPDHVAFVRFVPEVTQTSQVFAPFIVDSCAYLTLCRYPDRTWRVWGLGNRMVSAGDVGPTFLQS